MRTFERTHPWISFRCQLGKAGAELWISFGEASSKCEHISRVPLRPATAQALHQLYLAKGVAATTAIEGNTLSEEQVLKAVEGKLVVPPSKRRGSSCALRAGSKRNACTMGVGAP